MNHIEEMGPYPEWLRRVGGSAVWRYGHVESTGAAKRGRAGGLPIAIVWGPAPGNLGPADMFEYRYWAFIGGKKNQKPTWSYSHCPQACYCYLRDILNVEILCPDERFVLCGSAFSPWGWRTIRGGFLLWLHFARCRVGSLHFHFWERGGG